MTRAQLTVSDLEGRDFCTVAEAASIMMCDERTVRRRCADGTIPAIKTAGWIIPASWLRRIAEGQAA